MNNKTKEFKSHLDPKSYKPARGIGHIFDDLTDIFFSRRDHSTHSHAHGIITNELPWDRTYHPPLDMERREVKRGIYYTIKIAASGMEPEDFLVEYKQPENRLNIIGYIDDAYIELDEDGNEIWGRELVNDDHVIERGISKKSYLFSLYVGPECTIENNVTLKDGILTISVFEPKRQSKEAGYQKFDVKKA